MRALDLIGKTFGRLRVLSRSGVTPAGHVTWNCECGCGNSVIRTGTSLTRSKYSSCGCWKPPSGKDSPHWEGVGDISAAWWHNVVHRSASGRKSRSGITKKLDITIEYAWELFLKQDRRCALTGLELRFPKKSTSSEYKSATASLDRIDSTIGYVKGNVQWVHKDINIMKNTYSNNYFINMCKLVANV